MTDEEWNQGVGTESAETAPVGRTITAHKDLTAALTDFCVRNPNVISNEDFLTITGGKPAAHPPVTCRTGLAAVMKR